MNDYDPASLLDVDGLLKNGKDAIFTFSGHFIRPLDANPADVYIEDIAHALSCQCRWTGHVSRFYSVAEHSVLVSQCVPGEYALDALMHDATEAYLADLARPVKKAPGLGEIYLEAEARLAYVIAQRFGLLAEPLSVAAIKDADEWVLWAEARELLPELGKQMPVPPLDIPISGWSPAHAEGRFLEAFQDLGGETRPW